jgi:predicted transcriptional regulator
MAQQISFSASKELKEQLEEEAKKQQRSVSFIVRVAVEQYFKTTDNKKKEEN